MLFMAVNRAIHSCWDDFIVNSVMIYPTAMDRTVEPTSLNSTVTTALFRPVGSTATLIHAC